MEIIAVKALDDWELDITAAPFTGSDSDGQTFDAHTDFMLDSFKTPVVIYHHGIEPGAKQLQKKPVVIGKTQSVEVRNDGVHIRVLLDKTLEWARRVWDAAKKGLAVASSDSVAHLARLEVNGKTVMYEKNKAGRISVWPLAGISIWDMAEGNFKPASRYALAMPAVKAIYKEAGLPFPDSLNIEGDSLYAEKAAKRARIVTETKKHLAKINRILGE